MITTKGGYAIADFSFLSETKITALFSGESVEITEEEFKYLHDIAMCDKPIYISIKPVPYLPTLFLPATPMIDDQPIDQHYAGGFKFISDILVGSQVVAGTITASKDGTAAPMLGLNF